LVQSIKNIRTTIWDLVDSDLTDSWSCDSVSIMRLNDGKEWTFPVKRWIHPQRPAYVGRKASEKPTDNESMVLLNDCYNKMKTGDLICFESYSWYSSLTKKITKSKFSHVGLVVVEDEAEIRKELEIMGNKTGASAGAAKPDQKTSEQAAITKAVDASSERPRRKVVLTYESTRNGDHTPDCTSGLNPYTGVHAFEIRQRVSSYTGRLWWIPLQTKIDPKLEKAMVDWLKLNHAKRTPYDYAQMIGAGLDHLFAAFGTKNREDLSEMFCSEMVAAALRYAGAVPADTSPSDATPNDCAMFPCYHGGKVTALIQ